MSAHIDNQGSCGGEAILDVFDERPKVSFPEKGGVNETMREDLWTKEESGLKEWKGWGREKKEENFFEEITEFGCVGVCFVERSRCLSINSTRILDSRLQIV